MLLAIKALAPAPWSPSVTTGSFLAGRLTYTSSGSGCHFWSTDSVPGAPWGSHRVPATLPTTDKAPSTFYSRDELRRTKPFAEDARWHTDGPTAERCHFGTQPLVGKVLLHSTHIGISVFQLWCQVQGPPWSRGRDYWAGKASCGMPWPG